MQEGLPKFALVPLILCISISPCLRGPSYPALISTKWLTWGTCKTSSHEIERAVEQAFRVELEPDDVEERARN